MRKSLIVGLLMALSLSVFSPVATAQTRCETLKSEIQEMLGQEYAGKGKAAALEYSKRIVKAYQLGFKNRNCLTPQEYEGAYYRSYPITRLLHCSKAQKESVEAIFIPLQSLQGALQVLKYK